MQTPARLGPYEIREPIGEGGMGKVYRAWDSRLERSVAVKVLPPQISADPKRLWRFAQEARAAGRLNHPNILAVYDVGAADGVHYVVSEVLEGQTLRDRMGGAPLPLRKVIDYAVQIARGLAEAHDKGIVHRDLKPDNVFVTHDGQVKILDFGLAKFEAAAQDQTTDETEAHALTDPGTVLGTVAYMSPEQVRGDEADARSDIFSFGVVLYEMLAGRPAFRREHAVETMNAILKEEPPDLATVRPGLPPALEAIVRHCLEKSPGERFQSARDVAFGLAALSGLASVGVTLEAVRAPRGGRLRTRTVAAAAGIAAVAGLIGVGTALRRPDKAPSFRQLTFRRGTLHAARFAPDGQTIVFSAGWDGRPLEVFQARLEGPEARSLGLPSAQLLALSSRGEAVVTDGYMYFGKGSGNLARAALAGGAPREVARGVQQADWTPDGSQVLVTRDLEGKIRLEFPPGRMLYETAGWISSPRFSPDGSAVAFLEHPVRGDDRGGVALLSVSGEKKTLLEGWGSLQGLAWHPDGKEIWFTGARTGVARALYAVPAAGPPERLVARSAGPLTLQDVGRDGRVLVVHGRDRVGIAAGTATSEPERDLSWLDRSISSDLSADGNALLFYESGEGGGAHYGVYLRPTDGGPAVRLGDGLATSLSPDGQWVLAIHNGPPPRIQVLPTGAGEGHVLAHPELEAYHWASFFPDGKRIAIAANARGGGVKLYAQDVGGGPLQVLTPAVTPVFWDPISPDGASALLLDLERRLVLHPIAGGPAREVPGRQEGDVPIGWSADGRAIHVFNRGWPLPVSRISIPDGRRSLRRGLAPVDSAGITGLFAIRMAGDGDAYVYSYVRVLSDLFLMEGVS